MKFRWTMKDCSMTDSEILLRLVEERRSELNPYAPLNLRLQKISNKLYKRVNLKRKQKS